MKIYNSKFLISFVFLLITRSLIISQDLLPEQIYENVNSAVVVIISYDFNGNIAKQGSGVVLNDKGYIVTNYHVFAECERMEIMHYNKIIKYTDIIGVDVEKDILILKIEDNTFPYIPIAEISNLKVGQRVYAIGSPLGLENSMSEGIISGLRNVDEFGRNYIQISAGISPGSSGGAIVNSKGELIGISTLSMKEGQNLNFAIPVTDIMDVQIVTYSDKKSLELLNLYFKAFNAAENGKYNEALNMYSEYIKANPDNGNAYNNRGYVYAELKKYTEAISDFTEAIRIKPEEADAYYNRGSAYTELSKYTEAILDYTEAIRLKPEDAIAFFNRGSAFYELSKYTEAISDFTEAIRIRPEYADAYVNRGLVNYTINKNTDALSDYTHAIEIRPDDAEAYYNRGLAFHKLGKYTDELSDYTQAIEINPNISEVYYNRGFTYYNLKKYDEALSDFSQSIKLNPEDFDSYFYRGFLYGKFAKYADAISDFTHAINIKADVAATYFYRGNAYFSNNNCYNAVRDWKQAIKLNPDYESTLKPMINKCK